MYLSRLAAQKEHAFMQVLHREKFPVPEPISWNRHTVVMEFIDAFPLRMIESVPEPGKLYAELMDIIVQLAQRGLIHGDFNEFNILIKESEDPSSGKIKLTPIVIDFPQTVSTNHVNAQMYFDRDVGCIKRYFDRRFKYVSDEPGPFFKDAVKGIDAEARLDVEVEASGFSRKMARELERYVEVTGGDTVEAEVSSGDQASENDDVEDDEQDEFGEDNVIEEAQLDDPKLAEEVGNLSIEDDLAVKPVSGADFGLTPLEMSHDPEVVAEKIYSRKKAGGWAI